MPEENAEEPRGPQRATRGGLTSGIVYQIFGAYANAARYERRSGELHPKFAHSNRETSSKTAFEMLCMESSMPSIVLPRLITQRI